MKSVGLILSWVFAVLCGLLTVSFFLMGNWPQAPVLLFLTLVLAPPFRTIIERWMKKQVPWWGWIGSFIVLLAVFVMVGRLNRPTSVYKSPEIKARFLEIYDEKMKEWPVPYEDVYLDTSYGKVHVIVSGPEYAPPLILLHASGVAGWSWKYNVAELSRHFRTYAIDLIGDAGKSEFTALDHIMEDGKDQAELYTEITDKLGVEKAYVIGASEGGFIGTNYALHAPDRVVKLALLGPMGYTGAVKSSLRIMFAQFFPFKPIQDSTFKWAFSNSAELKEDFEEWFRLLMTGYNPAKVIPLPFSAEERQSLQVPVLIVLGTRDKLVGDPVAARELVQDIPDVRVEVLETGHLIAGEQPEQTNALLLEFFASP
jgi:pimeloyl-ACP methyl ester carboxylesterase